MIALDKEAALRTLKKAQECNDDLEVAHSMADLALCDFLVALGYSDVVAEWVKVEKWYA